MQELLFILALVVSITGGLYGIFSNSRIALGVGYASAVNYGLSMGYPRATAVYLALKIALTVLLVGVCISNLRSTSKDLGHPDSSDQH
jgi:hypothetical protein